MPFTYQGQYFDEEVELAYNRFRWYDNSTGIYISQDPIAINGGFNLYAYVSDVNSWVDVLGLSCSAPKNKKTSYNSLNRRDAFRQAKRDADIPMSQKPSKIEKLILDDGKGSPVMRNGQPVTFREYHYKNNKGDTIIIQEHSLGHTKAIPNHGAEPHFNVRPISNIRTGSVQGTHGHYNF